MTTNNNTMTVTAAAKTTLIAQRSLELLRTYAANHVGCDETVDELTVLAVEGDWTAAEDGIGRIYVINTVSNKARLILEGNRVISINDSDSVLFGNLDGSRYTHRSVEVEFLETDNANNMLALAIAIWG